MMGVSARPGCLYGMAAEPLDNADSIILRGTEARCPHAVVGNFLGADVVRQLLCYIDQRRAEFIPATVYRQQHRADISDVEARNCLRLDKIGPFEAMIKPEIERILPTALMKLGLLDRQVIAREFEFCAYGDGGLFRAHHDVLPYGRPRIVSCIYYFFREPARFTGGELRLYGWPNLDATGAQERSWIDVPPIGDSLVIFPSALRHEVRPVTCASGDWAYNRFTINCWAYRRKAAGAAS